MVKLPGRSGPKPLLERFNDSYIPEPNSGCWLWDAHIVNDRHPQPMIMVNSRSRLAHRVAYELFVGPIPANLLVCHKCDVSLCVNHRHLYAGTHRDNTMDAIARGRYHNPSAKLTDELARAVFLDPRGDREIAAAFGVSRHAVHRVKTRKRWARATEGLV